MDKMAVNAKVAGGSIGANVGILIVWGLKTYLTLPLGDGEVAAIIALCSFVVGYLIKVPEVKPSSPAPQS